ncbi:oplophorus-luciferin 2-monooxygenase non-catalytic subunit-like [Penaeus chinensis]|uniref:oplophorus-luciferin 2-monooxygenase non-catalytic subunit-like n=1 Tax=Penaeus chinensis TaxID=139456 RepID=UPI001FB65447|nr:oplophorus-luciferin 2-monooxygenase non-catalytic subunit-like [Penaeus chinensis]
MASLLLVVLLGLFAARPASSVIRIRPEEPVPRDWPCPLAGEIDPCTCEADENLNLNLNCSHVVDDYELQRVFTAMFPFDDYQSFTIIQDRADMNDIRNLESGIFGDITFEHVNIMGTKIQTINENVFLKSHERLKHLELSGNLISKFPFETLPSFLKLETFSIDDNMINLLPNLESDSLKFFSINDNVNLEFEIDLFTRLPELQSISMKNISLLSLSPGMFSSQKNLTTLRLDDNLLMELKENAVVPLNPRLEELSFAGNRITEVTHDAIHAMVDDSYLSFANNHIQTIPMDSWKGIFSQVMPNGIIDLSNNPLECGCDLKWIMVDYKDDYLHLLSRETACNSGELVSDINPDFFDKFC